MVHGDKSGLSNTIGTQAMIFSVGSPTDGLPTTEGRHPITECNGFLTSAVWPSEVRADSESATRGLSQGAPQVERRGPWDTFEFFDRQRGVLMLILIHHLTRRASNGVLPVTFSQSVTPNE